MLLTGELGVLGRNPYGTPCGGFGAPLTVAAAELAELAFLGRVSLDARWVRVTLPQPTGLPALDPPLHRLVARGRPVRLARFLHERTGAYPNHLEQLRAAGLVEARSSKVLGLFTRRTYLPQPWVRAELTTRIWHLLRGWRAPEQRTLTLAALVQGGGMDRELFAERQDRAALKRIRAADPLACTVHNIIAGSTAATNTAIIAAGAAAASSGS